MGAKGILKSILALVPQRLRDRILVARRRRTWRSRANKLHLEYFEEYEKRRPFILALKTFLLDRLGGSGIRKRIIEFGCSGGNNLRLIRELWPNQVSYCGLDINPTAIEFARQAFPDALFHVCSDRDLAKLAPELGHFDLFLVAGVLYYLDRRRAQMVLNQAAAMADYVLVCDDLRSFGEPAGSGAFCHPFAAMCQDAGLEIQEPPTSVREGDNHSWFIARSGRASRQL